MKQKGRGHMKIFSLNIESKFATVYLRLNVVQLCLRLLFSNRFVGSFAFMQSVINEALPGKVVVHHQYFDTNSNEPLTVYNCRLWRACWELPETSERS